MNMTINVEMTPEELRQFLGLPDLSAMQQTVQEDWLKRYKEQLAGAGPGAADPAAFFKPMMASGFAGNAQAMEAFNKAFWSAFSGAAATTKPDADD